MVEDDTRPQQIVALSSSPDTFLNLFQGKVDVVVVDDTVTDQYIANSDNLAYVDIESSGITETAMTLTKGDSFLKEYVNQLIEQDRKDGTFDRWMAEHSESAQKNTTEE